MKKVITSSVLIGIMFLVLIGCGSTAKTIK
jgi:hypothetical protein